MKKNILGLTLGVVMGLVGVTGASAESGQALPVAPAPDNSRCTLKTDLPADMVAKCTEAMAKGDKAMLEGCCQEAAPESRYSPTT